MRLDVEYIIRVYRSPDRWTCIDLLNALQYVRSERGCGMQTLADPGSPEYARVMELCDRVRDAMIELDGCIRGLEES